MAKFGRYRARPARSRQIDVRLRKLEVRGVSRAERREKNQQLRGVAWLFSDLLNKYFRRAKEVALQAPTIRFAVR